MSVLCANEYGSVLDHQLFLDNCYKKTSVEGRNEKFVDYKCLPELYEIREPFMMDTQFEKIHRQEEENQTDSLCQPTKVRKRKKRERKLNEGEQAAADKHVKVMAIIKKAHDQLIRLSKKKGYFPDQVVVPPCDEEESYVSQTQGTPGVEQETVSSDGETKVKSSGTRDNNQAARKAAQIVGPGDTLKELLCIAPKPDMGNENVFGEGVSPDNVFNCMTHHPSSVPSVRPLIGARYILPPCSKFLLSDICHLEPLVEEGIKYDVIVMDPPWQNKSVKRKKSYDTLSNWDLLKLPIPSLVTPGTLVVVWVTNRCQHQNFVRDILFPRWDIQMITTWYWLKITKNGTPILDLDSPHKKPYESLMLGRVKCGNAPRPLPEDRVLISVPCSIHSRKPPLSEVLMPYLPTEPKCVELFARNLHPGWTSWGNEVLRFQHIDFFKADIVDWIG